MIQQTLELSTQAKTLLDITDKLKLLVNQSNVDTGLCHLFIQHTSCSLIISENCDPDVLRDLESFMSRVVSEDDFYHHSLEGKDDMPAHIRSVLTQTSLSIPICDGRLALGTWQAVYLWEHRAQAHQRRVLVTMQD